MKYAAEGIIIELSQPKPRKSQGPGVLPAALPEAVYAQARNLQGRRLPPAAMPEETCLGSPGAI